MMQHRIEEHPDFESTIQNDPIELLKAIKIVMHDPIRAKYPYTSLMLLLWQERTCESEMSEKDKIPREDWAIHKAELHMQAEQKKDDDEASQSDKSSKKTRWSGVQVCLRAMTNGVQRFASVRKCLGIL